MTFRSDLELYIRDPISLALTREYLMKRTPLTRKTPMARGTSKLARSPMRRTRSRQPVAKRDTRYLAWVRTQGCTTVLDAQWHGCSEGTHAHHSRSGAGTGQKAHDHRALPLCDKHHAELHALSGYFRGWTRERLRAFENAEIERLRALYEKTKGTTP